MTDKLKKYLDLATKYKTASSETLKTMMACRTYASLNDPTHKVEDYVAVLKKKCKKLSSNIVEELDRNPDLTDDEEADVVIALNYLSNSILKLDKSDSVYEYVKAALTGEDEVIVSAKKKDNKSKEESKVYSGYSVQASSIAKKVGK